MFSKFDNETQPSRVSELIADSIWVIEQSIEANRSITQETIKNAQSPTPTSTERLSILSSARQSLIDLSKLLISPNSNSQGICILDINHCKLSWEYGFLSELGIIPFTADLIGKQATRLNTGLQFSSFILSSKFNFSSCNKHSIASFSFCGHHPSATNNKDSIYYEKNQKDIHT